MADDLRFKNQTTPPVKDGVGGLRDGILTGRELAAQMFAEDELGPEKRTPNERVQGVLDAMGLRKEAVKYGALIKQYSQEGNDLARDQLNADYAANIQRLIERHVAMSSLSTYPITLEQSKNEIRANPDINTRIIDMADLENLDMFAKTFKGIFPNGVKILPNEVMGIMAPFQPEGGFNIQIPQKKPDGQLGILSSGNRRA